MPVNSLGAQIPRIGWGEYSMLFAANAFYANVSEPTKIIATMEEDIVKHKDKMFPLDFESLLLTYRHLLAEEIWLLPYPKKML